MQTNDVRFIFRGNAMPCSGRITNLNGRPLSLATPSAPTSALTVAGGVSEGSSRGDQAGAAFGWGATSAKSSGLAALNGNMITTVSSSIASFSATNGAITFHADLLEAIVISDHPRIGQPSIKLEGIVFGDPRNRMLLDQKDLIVEYDDDLNRFLTFDSFEHEYRRNHEFFRKYQNCLTRPRPGEGKFGEPLPRVGGGYVSLSIVRRIHFDGKTFEGNVLGLEGFGQIYFGEVLMNENNRRLTVVRLELKPHLQSGSSNAETAATSVSTFHTMQLTGDMEIDLPSGATIFAEMACAEVDPNGSWGN
jgi:hypothetical protein